MQKTKKKQLALKKEYVQLLASRNLDQVRGGFITNGSSYYGCDDSQCDCGGGGE
jgi:hypothetical protein